MKKIITMILILLLITGLVLTGCSSTEPEEVPEIQEESTPAIEEGSEVELLVTDLIESRCTTCHNLETAYKERPLDQWQEVIDRMVDQRGANLNDEEREIVVEYLEDNYSN